MAEIKEIPNPFQQKRFAKKFTQEQWDECCESKAFVTAVQTDLAEAEIIAVKILGELWNPVNDQPYV